MAYSTQLYTADGVLTDFTVTFDYLDRTHLVVRVDKVDTTDVASAYLFTWVNDTTIRIVDKVDSNPVPNDAEIILERVTPVATPAVTFNSGASLPPASLNKMSQYLTYALQEAVDRDEEFTKLYLGASDTAPLTDNDGEAIQAGAVYWNTTEQALYYWTGTAWILGDSTVLAQAAKAAAESAQAAAEAAAENAALAAATAASSGGATLIVVPDATDATAYLQTELDTFGAAGGGRVNIRRSVITDAIRIDSRLNINYSNIKADFQSPVEYGALGSVRARGDQGEYLRVGPDQPELVLAAYNDGSNKATFELEPGDAAEFIVGDIAVVRGLVTAADSTIEKQIGIIDSVDLVNDIIKFTEPLATFDDQEDLDSYNAIMGTSFVLGDDYEFRVNYIDKDGNQLYNPTSGAPSTTKVQPMKASLPRTGSFTKGLVALPVVDASIFTLGDIVEIIDDRDEDTTSGQPGGFTSFYNHEIKRITSVDTGTNTIYIDAPLRMNYDNAYKARVSVLVPLKYVELKFKKISWHTPGTSTNMHAMHLDYCAHSKMSCEEMDGWSGKVGSAGRISGCYDCHMVDTNVHGGYDWVAPANYGAIIYRSSFCSIENCHISNGRHSILLSGCDHITVRNNVVTDDYNSAIDTHATGCYNILIEGNRVVAGLNEEATQKAGIRIGNPSHVIPDTDVIVRNNVVIGYNGASDHGIDFMAPATGLIIENNVIDNCETGIANNSNSSTRVTTKVYTDSVIIRGNTFLNCDKAIDVEDTPLPGSKGLVDVFCFDNIFKDCTEYVQATDITRLVAKSNKVIDPADVTKVMWDLEGLTTTQLDGSNDAANLNNPVRLTDIDGAVVIYNSFGDSGAILEAGTTANTTAFANDHTPPASGGGGDGLSIEKYMSGIAVDFATTAQLPNDDSAPLQTEGAQIISQVVLGTAGQTVEVEAVFPYLEISGTTGPVTLTLWAGSTLIGVAVDRITNGAASGGYMAVRGTFVSTSSDTVECRIGNNDGTTTITVHSRFADAIVEPYLLVRRATQAADSGAVGVAAGGTTGQMLQKLSGTDYDTGWVNNPVPAGGTTNQVLRKASNTDHDTEWADNSGGHTIYRDATGVQVAASTIHEWTPGLGQCPDWTELWLECTTADNGYAVGDRLRWTDPGSTAQTNIGYSLWWDASTSKIKWNVPGNVMYLRNAANSSNAWLTAANWKAHLHCGVFS